MEIYLYSLYCIVSLILLLAITLIIVTKRVKKKALFKSKSDKERILKAEIKRERKMAKNVSY